MSNRKKRDSSLDALDVFKSATPVEPRTPEPIADPEPIEEEPEAPTRIPKKPGRKASFEDAEPIFGRVSSEAKGLLYQIQAQYRQEKRPYTLGDILDEAIKLLAEKILQQK